MGTQEGKRLQIKQTRVELAACHSQGRASKLLTRWSLGEHKLDKWLMSNPYQLGKGSYIMNSAQQASEVLQGRDLTMILSALGAVVL